MKGKAIIQMINPFTKKVEEQFENKNIITNAIKNAFYLPPQWQRGLGLLSSKGIINWQNNLCPLNRNGLGGILLWDETIPENIETVYPPMSVNNVGFAGGNYSGANAFKGTLNSIETVALSNGWRNVWDFDTSRCNGKTIKSLSLTHVNCGNNGWLTGGGVEYTSSGWTIETGGFFGKENILDKLIGFVDSIYGTKEDYNTILCCAYLNSSSFKFYKRRKPTLNSLKINDFNLSLTGANFDEVVVNFGVTNDERRSRNSNLIGNDLHIVNYWNATTLEHIIVNLSDYSFTRNLISTSGHSKSISKGGAKIFFDNKYWIGCTDESFIILDNNGTFLKNENLVGGNNNGYTFYVFENRLFYTFTYYNTGDWNDFFELNTEKKKKGASSSNTYMGIKTETNLKHPLSFVHWTDNSTTSGIMASNYYLGSINNLATPIVKTADFNMKIIYEITNN